jgi:hypothetical protein
MHRREVDGLDPRRPHWVAAVVAPRRDWSAAPGCRAHARFLVAGEALRPSLTLFERCVSRADCLIWIMANRRELAEHMPGATVRPVPLADWLLGLD